MNLLRVDRELKELLNSKDVEVSILLVHKPARLTGLDSQYLTLLILDGVMFEADTVVESPTKFHVLGGTFSMTEGSPSLAFLRANIKMGDGIIFKWVLSGTGTQRFSMGLVKAESFDETCVEGATVVSVPLVKPEDGAKHLIKYSEMVDN